MQTWRFDPLPLEKILRSPRSVFTSAKESLEKGGRSNGKSLDREIHGKTTESRKSWENLKKITHTNSYSKHVMYSICQKDHLKLDGFHAVFQAQMQTGNSPDVSLWVVLICFNVVENPVVCRSTVFRSLFQTDSSSTSSIAHRPSGPAVFSSFPTASSLHRLDPPAELAGVGGVEKAIINLEKSTNQNQPPHSPSLPPKKRKI